jgi:hypothetical protein
MKNNKKYFKIILVLICFFFWFSGVHSQTANSIISTGNNGQPKSMVFLGDSVGILIISSQDSVLTYATNNLGLNWLLLSKFKIPTANNLTNDAIIAVIEDSVLILYIGETFIYKSFDLGLTWYLKQTLPEIQSYPGNASCSPGASSMGYSSMQFLNDTLGYITRFEGIYKSTNGGELFNIVSPTSCSSFYMATSSHFLDVQNGWVATNTSTLKRTFNGGITWNSIGPIGNALKDMHFLNQNKGYGLSSGRVDITNNGGIRWDKVGTDTLNFFNSYDPFIDYYISHITSVDSTIYLFGIYNQSGIGTNKIFRTKNFFQTIEIVGIDTLFNSNFTIGGIKLKNKNQLYLFGTKFGSGPGIPPVNYFSEYKLIENNNILNNQTITYGAIPDSITGPIPIGINGNFTYSWIISIQGPNNGFSVAPGISNQRNYKPGNTYQTSWYKRVVYSGGTIDTSNAAKIQVVIPPPIINSFSPVSGSIGTIITIKGIGITNVNSCKIGGVDAIIISRTDSTINVMVMPGTLSGTIFISNISGNTTSGTNFMVKIYSHIAIQQGSKLLGAGAIGSAGQGSAVSISADGNTAIVGGMMDSSGLGAAWIYTRIGTTWTQQGNKLVGTGAIGAAGQGVSVSLSADGNTAIVGGYADNNYLGAVWVFIRKGSIWTQQGNKLVGSSSIGNFVFQGRSVALSADGNTAIVCGSQDNGGKGAAWVWIRNEGIWTQQGNKLVGTGSIGTYVYQGQSVSLSADGNTALVGGEGDSSYRGAVWVYTRSGNTWTQQGSKLVGSGGIGNYIQQGASVSLSADGHTALVGGYADNNYQGAVWVFTRSGNTWTQQGSKMVGTGNSGASYQGYSVTLSADGNTALVGGILDSNSLGATWVYSRSGTTWLQQSSKLVGTGATGSANQGSSVSVSADGTTAIVGGNGGPGSAGGAWIYSFLNNANLINLTLSSGTLIPAFSATSTNYRTSVTTGTTSVNITPYTADTNATIQVQVNGGIFSVVSNGTASYSLSLNIGINTINVKIIAPDGISFKLYTISITRLAGPPNITSFTPSNGPVGTLVRIIGTNLGANSSLNIGGAAGLTISNDDTILVAMVMPSATTGPVIITNLSGNDTSSNNFTVTGTTYPSVQLGTKLVGTGAIGNSRQGRGVSISADGNTALIGGYFDDSHQGAAWVYIWNGSIWTQQGSKLVGTGAIGNAEQGVSVSLSADGNTALVGGHLDSSNQGAAWVFVRNGSNWSQQGSKLVGTGSIGPNIYQGYSVSLSGDGNTAVICGFGDNYNQGAAWVFIRSENIWKQQGAKLFGTGATGSNPPNQGMSVSISADGNTVIVGGYGDNNIVGAAWIFIRNGDTWSQQGNKLVGSGYIGTAQQGSSVALSANGNTAIVGGFADNASRGAVWIFSRNNGIWSQQGPKLVGIDSIGTQSFEGTSVSLSADGNTAIVGGSIDNGGQGATRVYSRSGTIWSQKGNKLVGTGNAGNANQGYSVSLSANGNTAIIGGVNDNSGKGAAWIYTASSNADLSSMFISAGTLLPSFSQNTNAYAVSLSIATASITVTPSKADPNATIQVQINAGGYSTVASGTASSSLPLNIGNNMIEVKVTAQDGTTSKIYSIIVSTPQPPIINSFMPTSGPIGTLVTIYGRHFNTTAADNFVYFGPVRAIVTEANDSILKVLVPIGANYKEISVTSLGLTALSKEPFGLIFQGPINFIHNTFKTRDTVNTSNSNSYFSITTDFNNDGRPDIASVSYDENLLNIIRNTSVSQTLSFAPKVSYNTLSAPLSVNTADIDGDGLLDIVVAPSGANFISIYRNTSSLSTISFATKVDFATSPSPAYTAIKDLDGDGKLDIVVATDNSNSLNVFRNTSTIGNLALTGRTDFAYGRCTSVALDDLDGDGKNDIIMVLPVNNNVAILRNISSLGSLSFATKIDNFVGSPSTVVSGDIDGDSKKDIVAASYGNSKVSVFRNTSTIGSISLAQKIDFNTGTEDWAVSLNDMNGDGKVDILSANYQASSISILKNNSSTGSINFASKVDYSAGTHPWNISISDYNLDSFPDILTSNKTTTYSSILLNNGLTIDSNIINGDQTICAGLSPTLLTGTTPNTRSGIYSFSWIKSNSGPDGGYLLASGNSSLQNYNPGVLTNTSWFKRVVNTGSFFDTSQAVMINVIALPIPTISGATSNCVGSSSIYTTPSNINRSYFWTITGGTITAGQYSNSITIVWPNVGSGTLMVMDSINGTGCKTTTTIFNTTINPNPNPAISGFTSVCENASETYIIPFNTGRSYRWSVSGGIITSGQNSNTINVTWGSAGNGSLVAIDSVNITGCKTITSAYNVLIKSVPPQSSEILGNVFPCLGSNQIYKINRISTATSYSWSLPSGWSISGNQTDTFINLTVGANNGNIQVNASNNCGINTSRILGVTVNNIPAIPNAIIGNNSVCKQGTATFFINRVAGASNYTWTLPSGWSFLSAQGDSFIDASIGATSGILSVNSGNICGNSSNASKVLTLDSIPPKPLIINGNTTVCLGSSQNYYINKVKNATSYSWNLPSGWSISGPQTDTIINVTVGANSGSIMVRASNICGISDTAKILVNSITVPIQPGIILGNNSPCTGTLQIYRINRVPVTNSYLWTVPSGWSIFGNPTDTFIQVAVGSTSGLISVTAVNQCGISTSRTLNTSIQFIPNAPISINGSNKVCKFTTTQYKIGRIANATSYTWTAPTGWIILGSPTDTFMNVASGITGGQITVNATNVCGSSLATTYNVQTDSIPVQPSLVNGSTNLCANTSQVYTISRIPNANYYTWSLPNAWTIISGQGMDTLNTLVGANSGNITVQASNSCGSSAQRTLGIIVSGSLPPQASPIAGNNFPCLGTTQVYTIPRIPLALSYTWSVPNGWTINAGQNDTFINVTVGPNSGNIQVTATNYCGTNTPRTLAVNVNTIPPSPTSIIGSNAVCKLGTSVFKINRVNGATTYTWSLPSGWGFLSTQGDTFVNTSIGSLSGNISVSAGNVCGNSNSLGKSTSLDSIPPIPSAISGNANPCLSASEGYSIVTIPNATSYNWSLPSGWIITSGTSTSAIIGTIGSNNGNILVSATNFCGTSSNRTLAATVKTIPPSPASIIGNLAVCKQSSATYKINRNASATSYTWTVPSGWSINNGNGDTIISVTTGNTGGNISVYASNICGNSSATSIIVSVDSIPPQPAIITGNINPCQSSSQAYSISSIANASSYNWIVPIGWSITNGQTSTMMQTNVGSQSGNIQIAAVNFCGTGNYKTLATLVESIPVIPTAIYGNTAVCKSTLQTFTTNRIANASSYTWSIPNGWTIITGLNDTFITVGIGSLSGNITVKANNFCGSSLNKNLFINVDSIPPQPAVISGNLNPCNGSQGTYSASILPNANSYIWTIPASWSIIGNQIGSTINVNVGNFDGQITVSGSNMCGVGVAKSSNLVVKNIPLQPSTVNGNTAVCKSSSLTYHITPVLSASAYMWSVPAGWIINAGQGDTLIRVSIGSISGNVSVVASNNCGSGIARTLFVNVDSIPPIPNQISGNNAPCANNTLNYSISKLGNANSYNWSVPSGWVINTGQGDTLINATISKTNGSILVSATNVCGTSLNRSLTIQVDSNPIITGNITGPPKPCYGIAQNYSIPSVSNATSYLWAAPANWINNFGQGTTSINISPSNTTGNISVVANNKCGISNQKNYSVGYDSIPVQPKLIIGNSTPCSNSNYAYEIENISNAINYVWTIPNGWNLVNNLESNILVRTSFSGGQISVYAENSCGIGLAQNLNTNIVTIPSKPILMLFEDTLCSGSNYVFKTDSDYFAKNYNWSFPNGYVINSGQGSGTINFTASNTSGNLKVVANNGFCIGDTNYQNIQVTRTPSTPNLITGNFAPCYATSVSYFTPLDSLSDSYFWKYPIDWNPQGPVASNSINLLTGSQTGKISVQAIKLGCKSSFKEDNLNVQFIPITPTLISGESYVRSNETRSYITPLISNAISYSWTLPSDWAILSGNGTNEVNVLTGDSSGLIRVNATNVCGTSNSKSLQAYSGVANGITNTTFDNEFGLYPIPSSDFITVEINGNPDETIEWTILSLLGQKVQTGIWKMKTKGPEAFQIDISSLNSANYVFELNKGSNKIYKKIVIVR